MWYEDQTDYKGYLPDFYQDVKEIRKLDEILNERMDVFKEAVKGLADNVCAVTAKEKGLVRSEGKTYEMKDGDVVLFRFNV